MANGTMTIEEQQEMELIQARAEYARAQEQQQEQEETDSEEDAGTESESRPYINTGEFLLLFFFAGVLDWLLGLAPLIGFMADVLGILVFGFWWATKQAPKELKKVGWTVILAGTVFEFLTSAIPIPFIDMIAASWVATITFLFYFDRSPSAQKALGALEKTVGKSV